MKKLEKNIKYFKIKVAQPLGLSKAKKLKMVSYMNGIYIFSSTVLVDNNAVLDYLKSLGCVPTSVSKLSLQILTE